MNYSNLTKNELLNLLKIAVTSYKDLLCDIIDQHTSLTVTEFYIKYNLNRSQFNAIFHKNERGRYSKKWVIENIHLNIEKEIPKKQFGIFMKELNERLDKVYDIHKAMRILKAKASKTRHGSLSHSELRLMDVLKLYFSEGKITEKDITNLLKSKNLSVNAFDDYSKEFDKLKSKEERILFCKSLQDKGYNNVSISIMIGRGTALVSKYINER